MYSIMIIIIIGYTVVLYIGVYFTYHVSILILFNAPNDIDDVIIVNSQYYKGWPVRVARLQRCKSNHGWKICSLSGLFDMWIALCIGYIRTM